MLTANDYMTHACCITKVFVSFQIRYVSIGCRNVPRASPSDQISAHFVLGVCSCVFWVSSVVFLPIAISGTSSESQGALTAASSSWRPHGGSTASLRSHLLVGWFFMTHLLPLSRILPWLEGLRLLRLDISLI